MAGTGVFPTEIAIVPTPSDQTVSTATQEQNFLNWLSATYQLPGSQAFQSVTIASGNITPNRSFLKVDTQAAASTDDLDHILLTNYEAGRVLFVRAADTNRTVVCKHAIGGSGQLLMLTSADFQLDDNTKVIAFILEGTSWVEIFRYHGNDPQAARTAIQLGTISTLNQGTTAGTSPAQVPIVDNIYGLKSVWIPAASFEPSTTGGCSTVQKIEFSPGNTVELLVLDFDGTASETAFMPIAFPKHWNAGTITMRWYYIVNAAVSTTVTWGARLVSVADNEAVNVAHGTAVSVTDTYLGTANKQAITALSAAITVSGTPADGEIVYLRIFRDPTVDTTTQDARLIGVQLQYTANKLNDS